MQPRSRPGAAEESFRARVPAELVVRAQTGEGGAKEELFRALAPLIESAVGPLVRDGVSIDDLRQAGALGALGALRGFDASRGVAFQTYAMSWIQGEARKAARRAGSLHIPDKKAALVGDVLREWTRLEARLGREPTAREVGAELGFDEGEVRVALELAGLQRVSSLEAIDENGSVNDQTASPISDGREYSTGQVESLLEGYFGLSCWVVATRSVWGPAVRHPSMDVLARLLDLEDALSRLPEDLYQVIELRDFRQLSLRSVCVWLGDVHENTVRNRHKKAVEAIVSMLNGTMQRPPRQREVSGLDDSSDDGSARTLDDIIRRSYPEFLYEAELTAIEVQGRRVFYSQRPGSDLAQRLQEAFDALASDDEVAEP